MKSDIEEDDKHIPLKISIREPDQKKGSATDSDLLPRSPTEKEDRYSVLTVNDPAIKKKLSTEFIKEIYNDTYKIGKTKIDKRIIDHFFRVIVVSSILGFSFYKIVSREVDENSEVWVGMISSIFGYSISLATSKNSSQQQKKE